MASDGLSDRDRGINVITAFWNDSSLGSETPRVAVTDIVSALDAADSGAVAYIGQLAAPIFGTGSNTAMQNLAEQFQTSIPGKADFAQALIDQGGVVDTSAAVEQGVVAGVEQAATVTGGLALAGLGTYVLVIAGIALLPQLLARRGS